MNKTKLLTLALLLISINLFSQEDSENNNSPVDSFLLSSQSFTHEIIKTWNSLEKNSHKKNIDPTFISRTDSISEKYGVMKIYQDNYIPCQFKYKISKYQYQNGVISSTIQEDIYIKNTLVAYRILQINEIAGIYSYNEEKFVLEKKLENQIQLYNCNSQLIIYEDKISVVADDGKNYEILVLSTSGQTIYKEKYEPNSIISIDKPVKNGVYFIFMFDLNSNEICTGKMLRM